LCQLEFGEGSILSPTLKQIVETNNNSFQYSEIHDPRRHSSPYVPTATAHRSSVGPDKGGSRLERSLAGRVDHDQESGLGLAWRPTGPDVHPTNSTPAPVYVGGGGVSPAAKLRYMDGKIVEKQYGSLVS
jgi:hypothetical protein